MQNKFVEHVIQSNANSELKLENLFLYNLFQLDFEYDDNRKTCTIKCPITEPMLNELGTVHGGIHTYIADTAIGHLLNYFSSVPHVTLEIKTSFLKSMSNGMLIAKASFVQEGKTIIFSQCEISNEEGEIAAVTTGTFYRLRDSK